MGPQESEENWAPPAMVQYEGLFDVDIEASSEEIREVSIAVQYKIVTDTHRRSSRLFLEN